MPEWCTLSISRRASARAIARAANIDESEAFLAIAERRLERFGERALLVHKRLQDDWPADLPVAPQALLSMSAIHHLEPAEKRTLYARGYGVLAPGGIFAKRRRKPAR